MLENAFIDLVRVLRARVPRMTRPVKNDVNAGKAVVLRGDKRVVEVAPRVGILHIDGFLRAGEHDGFAAVLNQIGKRAGRVGHRIRAVGDNKTVVSVVMIPQTFGQRQPAVRRHVGGINIHRLHRVNAAERTERGHAAQNIVGQKLRAPGRFPLDGWRWCRRLQSAEYASSKTLPVRW